LPTTEYYTRQAKLLFAMPAATADPEHTEDSTSRAQDYLALAEAMRVDPVPRKAVNES
jgi:hypothetical protein